MKLIILDRDGVINFDSPNYIKSPDEWLPIPGSLEAIATLKKAGYVIAVATNQSGVARGYYDLATLARIHEKMQNELKKWNAKIDMIVFCPHNPDMKCDCRKPAPGMLIEISKKLGVSLQGVTFIGDSLRDVEAGLKVGCLPVLVKTHFIDQEALLNKSNLPPIPVYADLAEAVNALLSKEKMMEQIKKTDKKYISEIDLFLQEFDQKNPQKSVSQAEEIKTFDRINKLRDKSSDSSVTS
jgi:D-glycero-D-manno-heptose 1,7-bisphosphate phosphatase